MLVLSIYLHIILCKDYHADISTCVLYVCQSHAPFPCMHILRIMMADSWSAIFLCASIAIVEDCRIFVQRLFTDTFMNLVLSLTLNIKQGNISSWTNSSVATLEPWRFKALRISLGSCQVWAFWSSLKFFACVCWSKHASDGCRCHLLSYSMYSSCGSNSKPSIYRRCNTPPLCLRSLINDPPSSIFCW